MKTNLIENTNEAIIQINKAVDERFFRNSKIIAESLSSDFLPVRFAAIKYHISEPYIYKLRAQQKIKLYKLGRLAYVKSSELESLFEEATS